MPLTENRTRFGTAPHRTASRRCDWTQGPLAEACGFDRKTVNRIENGRQSPSLDRVFVLADALGVQPLALFHRSGPNCIGTMIEVVPLNRTP
ncbi:DNA-binding XRE family transcriptional regulator [Saccharothrix ecbatanensis]|uniref:DNA-binding XRE family transcriptional regulator n=1 Tax=Saccharothrix ecbatanensis TaxID=1105145 RepID=A0A7W9HJR9_9PSEU|nr:helix-turn-helix transcriptional regulator [Saccharothrix ecbatanensis]MBB5803567.1 DNA-binding XRE family transcriptional regulator [Saccharothrix ecbatanensis]